MPRKSKPSDKAKGAPAEKPVSPADADQTSKIEHPRRMPSSPGSLTHQDRQLRTGRTRGGYDRKG